ncbi:ribosomal protein S18-alanine N-acetyltransferase [Haloimpatiens sp. FM7330]|uniref:ribosomal protein S18-alanine N-acetyltransferase n=1 Tax=Haloimpatiens sp. FM7330 TaxID=3298610 RepID=UPI0036253706
MNNILIKPLEDKYIDDVLNINSLSFPVPWGKNSFIKELQNNFAYYIIAIKDNMVVGYAGIWIIVGEAHIISIAVHPEYRSMGIGNLLMDGIFGICKKNSVYGITLEVRESNLNAQKLYEKYGFIKEGIRKFYYANNREDAIIMWNRDI